MNSEQDSDYETNISLPSLALEVNTSSPSSISETNTISTESTLTSKTNIISSNKPSPLWQFFTFNPNKPNNPICEKSINKIREVFNQYIITPNNITNVSSNKVNDDIITTRNYFHGLKRQRHESNFKINQETADELERYLALPCDEHVTPLLWWQAHGKEFPTLACMARDYLSIQASSVACEQAFSIAANTISQTRNRLNPETSRALLCSKNWIENEVAVNKI
ncbi:32500_t:CDS:2, partial [Gigaspora margarita]